MSAYFVFRHKVQDAETLNSDYLPKAVETLKAFDPLSLWQLKHRELTCFPSPNISLTKALTRSLFF